MGWTVTGLDLPYASLSLPGVTGLENSVQPTFVSIDSVFLYQLSLLMDYGYVQ